MLEYPPNKIQLFKRKANTWTKHSQNQERNTDLHAKLEPMTNGNSKRAPAIFMMVMAITNVLMGFLSSLFPSRVTNRSELTRVVAARIIHMYHPINAVWKHEMGDWGNSSSHKVLFSNMTLKDYVSKWLLDGIIQKMG